MIPWATYSHWVESASVPGTVAAGTVLAGKFELIEQLGSGGMGPEWRARSLALNAEVAIRPDGMALPACSCRRSIMSAKEQTCEPC